MPKKPYDPEASPKTPYAQSGGALITNRNQRKQFEAIGEPMESAAESMRPKPPAAARPTPPPSRSTPRAPTNWDKMAQEAEAERKRKRPTR